MDKTNTKITIPGGRSVELENPPFSEAGLTAGEGQSLFAKDFLEKSILLLRSPLSKTTQGQQILHKSLFKNRSRNSSLEYDLRQKIKNKGTNIQQDKDIQKKIK